MIVATTRRGTNGSASMYAGLTTHASAEPTTAAKTIGSEVFGIFASSHGDQDDHQDAGEDHRVDEPGGAEQQGEGRDVRVSRSRNATPMKNRSAYGRISLSGPPTARTRTTDSSRMPTSAQT